MNLPTLNAPDEFTDCLFVGGPLHNEVRGIPDYADAIFVSGEALMAVDEDTSHFSISPPDYVRHDGANVFRHNTCTEEQIDAFIAERDGATEDEVPQAAGGTVLDYAAGMRDACQAILDKFACPHCQPQYS